MKRMIFICILFIVTIIGCILEGRYVCKTFLYLEDRLYYIKQQLQKNTENMNTEENIKLLKELHAEWTEKKKVLKIFVWHTNLKDVEVGLSRIQSYTAENDFTEAYTEIQNLIDFSKHFRQDYELNLQNIF